MKVELQNGDRIQIPEGCKAIVKGGSVTFVKEEDKEYVIYWVKKIVTDYLK